MSNDEPKKVFEDFPTVECNNCQYYWDNSCDGVDVSSEAQNRPCKTFLATRSVVIPQEIKSLKKAIFWLQLSHRLLWLIIFAALYCYVLLEVA